MGFRIETLGKMDRSRWRITVRDDQGALWTLDYGGVMPTQEEVEEMWSEDRHLFQIHDGPK